MRLWASILFMILIIAGCIKTVPMPPASQQELTSYEVIFHPATAQTYSQSASDPYPPFKMTYAFFNGPIQTIKNEQVSRKYEMVGQMTFMKNWYDNETIAKLIRLHVPQKGGDAVLSYHMQQESAAVMKDETTGKFLNWYYGTINLEIIKYTDK